MSTGVLYLLKMESRKHELEKRKQEVGNYLDSMSQIASASPRISLSDNKIMHLRCRVLLYL